MLIVLEVGGKGDNVSSTSWEKDRYNNLSEQIMMII